MRICILGESIEKALNGEFLGGTEKQCALIAKALAAKGHEVFVLEPGSNAEKKKRVGNVWVVHTWDNTRGIPALRFVTYRMPSLLRRIKEISADVIYCRGTAMYAACLLLTVRGGDSKFVWALAAQHDLDACLTHTRTFNGSLYRRLNTGPIFNLSARILMKYSDMVFCQTLEQFVIAEKSRRNTAIIPSIFDQMAIPETSVSREPSAVGLWVGKFTGSKGERELLELAKLLPDVKFRAVGHVSKEFRGSPLYDQIVHQENIILTGRLQQAELMCEYSKSPLLVHTAPAEGFSNVFLEAWACGCPVVSLNVDPNKLLSDGNLGFCAGGDVEQMARQVKCLFADPEARRVMARGGKEYVRTVHSIEKVVGTIEEAFTATVAV
ncbi:MAG: glycosyltransferase family 4 protein [Planctomycetota bacterium]